MRLKSEIWAMAHIRRVHAQGAAAVVARKGDADAGAIFVRTTRADGKSALFGPDMGAGDRDTGERYWRLVAQEDRYDPVNPPEIRPIEQHLAREIGFDPDIWIIEIEDRDLRHFLGDQLVSSAPEEPKS